MNGEDGYQEDLDFALAISLQEHLNSDIIDITRKRNSEEVILIEESPKKFKFTEENDDLDYAIALSLEDNHTVTSDDISPVKLCDPKDIVDDKWELVDPNPNIHDLFVQFDSMFFNNTLTNRGVAVQWSSRMTLCAGLCCYEGRGGLCSIKLSTPLLKLRPRKDLVETLLHEMIHALLFVTANNRDRDGHGPEFLKHMHRINKATGANITVYHSFHNEVNLYRQHWWKCNGPCRCKPPFFGLVKRANNRAPSRHDLWWAQHQKDCGGTFEKIKEPEGYSKNKRNKNTSIKKTSSSSKDIREVINNISNKEKSTSGSSNVSSGPSRDTSSITITDTKVDLTEESYADRRLKLAEAAEKRLQKQTFGNKLTKTGRSQIKSNPPSTCSAVSESSINSSVQHIEATDIISTINDTTLPANNGSDGDIVLIEDLPGYDNHSVSGSLNGKEYCPICGRDDIPFATINAHISLCLEEMELFENETD